MDTAAIKPVLAEFRKRLADTIPDAQFLVWGSYAAGTNDEWSDIDVVVVSDFFKPLDKYDRTRFLFKRASLMEIRIDPRGATPEELAAAPVCTYIGTARETGVWVNV